MRTLSFILLTFCLPSFALAEDEPQESGVAQVAYLMTGKYTVIGRLPDSKTIYSGRISLDGRGKKLAFVRTINHVTVRGMGFFDTVGYPKNNRVLRLRFIQDGNLYYGIYQWTCDYDNYFRVTGYVYPTDKKSKSAGMEAFFLFLRRFAIDASLCIASGSSRWCFAGNPLR